jgi:glycosyltransferase involved in cell wall biosynthesis
VTRVAYVSTYVPKKCGLATYTHHLRQAVHGVKEWREKDPVVVLADAAGEGAADPLLWPLLKHSEEEYAKMARRINRSDVDVVSLQHEFGIFGGEAGRYILSFIRNLKKPLVTTFHTVFEHPVEPYASIQKEIAGASSRVIVMSRQAVGMLRRSFGIPEENIRFIPHGTPAPNPENRQMYRERLGWNHRKVLMTFGLLSRGKGLELVIRALPQVRRAIPDVLYVIAGQTHPEVKKREGEAYRQELAGMIRSMGLEDHVLMINRYLDEEELVMRIQACDVYVTPYPGMQQITSGTLAYAVGLGRPVLSTPYAHARDLLRDYPELLTPYGEPEQWADKIIGLLSNEAMLKQWERNMERIGRTMHWPIVAREHERLFAEVQELAAVTG